MNDLDALLFIDEKPEALLLYNALEERILEEIGHVNTKVQLE